jgi:hypothetical protein
MMRSLSILAAFFIFVACEARPSVKYNMITANSGLTGDEFDTYALRASKLRIDKSPTKEGEYELALVPVEAQGMKIGLIHADGIGITTNLVLSKSQNTDLVSEIGVAVSDKRIEYIKNVAEIIKTAAPLLAGFAAPEPLDADTQLPFEINFATELPKLEKEKRPKEIPINRPGVILTISAIPPDAVATDLIFNTNPTSSTSKFYFSSCRSITVDASIKDKSGKVQRLNFSGKIADPEYLQMVELPIKGKVSMHTQCGVSVSSETETGVSSPTAIAEALAVQGKAIKDAIDAAKKQ